MPENTEEKVLVSEEDDDVTAGWDEEQHVELSPEEMEELEPEELELQTSEGNGEENVGIEVPPGEIGELKVEEQVASSDQVPVLDTECAFIVYKLANGRWVADSNLNVMVKDAREATTEDFHAACQAVIRDLWATEAANRTVGLQQQIAAQLAQQMQTQRLLDASGGPGGSAALSALEDRIRKGG